MSLRIGAVSYLNTKPLIHGLSRRLSDCELVLDLPSRLADGLTTADLDVALIPSVEFLRGGEELAILSNACIACRGKVRSVRLLFRCPPRQVKTLALDEGSRTSAVLAQVLLHERFGIRPKLLPLPIEADYEPCPADAVLVIGDRAMRIDSGLYAADWDLGQHWWDWTGLPFVFAMWVFRQSSLSLDQRAAIGRALEDARDGGVQQVAAIAAAEAPGHRLSVEDCVSYFTRQLHFTLGTEERAGLDLFRARSERLGLLAPPPLVSEPLFRESIMESATTLHNILERAMDGQRLSPSDGLARCRAISWLALVGRLARDPAAASRTVSHLQHRPEYQLHQYLLGSLRFLRFYRNPKSPEGYVLDRETLFQKSRDRLTGRQSDLDAGRHASHAQTGLVHRAVVGAAQPLSADQPACIQPSEIYQFSKINRLTVREVLSELKAAGLGSLPGGGGKSWSTACVVRLPAARCCRTTG